MQSSWPDDGACLLQVFFITSSFEATQRKKTFTSDGDYQAYLERLAKYRRQYY